MKPDATGFVRTVIEHNEIPVNRLLGLPGTDACKPASSERKCRWGAVCPRGSGGGLQRLTGVVMHTWPEAPDTIAYLSSFALSNTSRGGSGSVDALPYLGPRPLVVAAGDEMVDRSFRWSDCGRSVFRGPPRWAWVPRSLLELAARGGRIVDGWAWSERLVVSGGSSAVGPSARNGW